MSSPEPRAVARMITLAPTTFLKGTGSGRSWEPTAGRYLSGIFQPSLVPTSRLVASAMLDLPSCSPCGLLRMTNSATRRNPAHPRDPEPAVLVRQGAFQ